ncbi:MAG: glucose-6-phosphate isomerase [Planctomycetota bacterium]|nr:glucose-6-phosphate isomerase [Planctomycetota bacterium]
MAITLERGMLHPNVSAGVLDHWTDRLKLAKQTILAGTGRGADFLGWLDPDKLAPKETLKALGDTAKKLRDTVDILVVVGIGGSYLGAKAGIEALATPENKARVLFAGQNISASYHSELLASLKNKRFALNVISKSGTTTEPAIAYRLLRALLIEQVGEEKAKELTVVTTDPENGALRSRAKQEGLTSFTIPGNVGGRFSVLTPVGLLPMAFAGIDIEAVVKGATDQAEALRNPDNQATCLAYAACRNALYSQGWGVETLAFFEPRLASLAEWWKQLFGESEGKDKCGLLPTSLLMTTDLHSLGQYVQDGKRQLFETFLWVDDMGVELQVPQSSDDRDGLSYLAGRSLAEINKQAWRGTQLAHREGGVPIMTLRIEKFNAHALGELFYFFESTCAISGTLLGVNPFDQPAVEGYKRNMFALLGKPGFEEEGERVRSRLEKYS